MNPKELAKALRNIGPVVAKQLVNVGIDSPEKLKEAGAIKAYQTIVNSGQQCGCYNAAYLYALEGAINDCDWRKLPEQRKREFKECTEKMRKKSDK
jgi:DNA transformation protein